MPHADTTDVDVQFSDGKAVLKAAVVGNPQLSSAPTAELYVTLVSASNSYGFTVESIEIRPITYENKVTEETISPWTERIIDLAFAVTGTVNGLKLTQADAARIFGYETREALYRYAFSLLKERMDGSYGIYVVWKLDEERMTEDLKDFLGFEADLDALPADIPGGVSDYVLFRNDDGLFFGHQPMGLPVYAELRDTDFRDGKAILKAAIFADPYSQTPSGYLYVTLIQANNERGFTIDFIETRTE